MSIQKPLTILLILLSMSAMASAQFGPSEQPTIERVSSGFGMLNTEVFDAKKDASISVFCYKNDVEWPDGCPGSNVPNIDSQDGDTPQKTDEAEMDICTATNVNVEIVANNDEIRVYDPVMNDNIINEFGCDYSTSREYTFRSTENYDGECGINEPCEVSGGEVSVARTTGSDLALYMDTGDTEGSEGGLIGFELTNEGNNGVNLIQFTAIGGNPSSVKQPKKNYVLKGIENMNNYLESPFSADSCPTDGSSSCEVALVDFTNKDTEVDVRGCTSENRERDCPLGYQLGQRTHRYVLGGTDTKAQIVYGKEYGGEFSPSVSETTAENKFHFCHETIPSQDGKTVYSPMPENADYSTENEYDQFICQNGEWNNVATCNDGLDNNQNGKTDHEADPVCDGNKGQPETSVSCDQPVVAYDKNDQKAAFYDPVQSGGELGDAISPRSESPYFSCRYNQKETVAQLEYDAESQEPVEFECTTEENPIASGGESGTSTGYSGPSQEKADTFCANRHSSAGGFAQDPMPAVQYFVPEEVIPTGPGEWATSSGFKPNMGFQTLHQAEYYFSKNSNNGPHDAERWNSMQDTYGYENDNPSEYEDAWVTANAGDLNENVASDDGELGDNPVFRGGFAGKCNSPEKWTNVNEDFNIWECDVPTGDTTITVNTYAMQTSGIEGNYAGIQVNRSELEKWEGAHGVPPEGNDHTGKLIVLAECWHGGPEPNDMPPEDERAKMSRGISSLGDKAVVAAEIPQRDNGPSSLTEGRYSCTYGFAQKINDKQAAGVPKDSPLFQNGGAANNQGWIVEGTQEFGKIETNVETISVPYTSDYEDEENPEQAWLEDQASDVNTFSSGEDPYQHFPTEGEHPDGANELDPYNQMRHPVEVFKGR
jgi:hypothetical protein